MKITLNIPDKRITDLIHGHGGSVSGWLHKLTGNCLRGQAGCYVQFDLEEKDEGNGDGKMRFGRKRIREGLTIMAQESPYQFGQFLSGDDDDVTFDTALQCIIFKKMVYA